MGRLPGIFHAGGCAWASPMFEELCHRKVSLSLVYEKVWAVRGVYPVARAGSYDFVVSPIKSFQIGSRWVYRCIPCQNTWIFKFITCCQPERKLSISQSQGLDVHQPPSPKTSQVHPDRFESAKRGRRGWSLTFTWESTKPKVWGNILTWDVRCRMVCRLKGMKLYLSEASVSVPLKVCLFCESNNKWIKISVISNSIIAKSNFLHCQFLQNYPHKIHHPGIEHLKCRLSCLHDGVLLEVANVPEWSMEDWWIPKVFSSNRSSISLQKQFWYRYKI